MQLRVAMAGVMLLAGCGSAERGDRDTTGSTDLRTMDVSEEAPPAAPGISITAAPGVAFQYHYAFRLPDARIAAVQEQHAQACERLAVERCRITGMRYRVIDAEHVEGMLAFKLDPAVARGFGRSAISMVEAAEGMLADAEISGDDAGAAIATADKRGTAIDEESRRIEARLAAGGIPREERSRLEAQLAELRGNRRAVEGERAERAESLARTPMTFNYGSGKLIPGYNAGSPLRSALAQSIENLVAGIAMILLILVTLLPWAIAGGVLWWLGRCAWRRWAPRPDDN